jgi:hypothetical protein
MPADLQHLELAARDALAERYGRALTDEEWAAAKHELLELAQLLRDWRDSTDEQAA